MVFYTLGVFLLSAFVAFWAVNMMVGRIWVISGEEVAAVFCVAVGASVLFFIAFRLWEVKPLVAVGEDGLAFKKGKKIGHIRYADIAGVREHESVLGRLVKTSKVVIETHLGSFSVYLSKGDVQPFFDCLPDAEKRSERKERGAVCPKGEKNVCFLSCFVMLTTGLVLFCAATFPAVWAMLGKFSSALYYLYAILAIYGLALAVSFGRYVYILARYPEYSVRVEEDRFLISYGKVAKTEHSLFFDSVLAFRLKQNFVERAFGLCRISAETKQKARGISDDVYFPFLMKREDAEALVAAVVPDGVRKAEKSGVRALVPYLEYALWFAAAIVILSVFLTPWFLLLLLLPAAAAAMIGAHGGYALGEDTAVFEYGIFDHTRLVVRYDDMKSVTASVNIASSRLKLNGLDVTVGQYTRVFSVGYIKQADFSELTEKLEKKVDKDS